MKLEKPDIYYTIGDKYMMTDRTKCILKVDYNKGKYDRIQPIFDFVNELTEDDWFELELYLMRHPK